MRFFHLALLASASILPAQNAFTSPAGMENVDGSSNHNYILFARPGMRWQQVDSTHRGQAYPNIASIAWRRDAAVTTSAPSTARTLTGLQVFLADSTVGGLSTDFNGLIVTTGGTGFGPRDLTPEGTKAVLEREAPGLAEAMRLCNPAGLGRLSRAIAGTRGRAVILNTPGSTSGCVETIEAVLDVLHHAVDLLAGGRPH